jgi:cytoskeletal protein RodZ
MKKLRVLLFAGLVFAVSSTLIATAQETTPAKTQGQKQAQEKKNDDGHRKHWWSMPHLHHKSKQTKTASPAPSSQAATAKPMKQTANPTHKGTITVSEKPVGKTTQTKPVKKTVASAHHSARPVHRTAARTAHVQPRTAKKTVASASHTKKTVRHNCSAEESKTGGCQAHHNTKPATTRS